MGEIVRGDYTTYPTEWLMQIGRDAYADIVHAQTCGWPQEKIDEFTANAYELKAEVDRRRDKSRRLK